MPTGQTSQIISSGQLVGQQPAGLPYPVWGQADGLGSVNRDPAVAFWPTWEFDRVNSIVVNNASTQSFGPTAGVSLAGTIVAVPFASGSIYSEDSQVQITQVAGASAVAGISQAVTAVVIARAHRGTNVGRGGFSFHLRFGFTTTTSNLRFCAGLTAENTQQQIVNAFEPSAVANSIFFAADQADASPTIMTNDGSVAAFKTPLTVARTKTGGGADIQGKLYDLWIACAPNPASTVRVVIIELSGTNYTRTVLFNGDIATQLPSPSSQLRMVCGFNSGTNAVDVQVGRFSGSTTRWKAS